MLFNMWSFILVMIHFNDWVIPMFNNAIVMRSVSAFGEFSIIKGIAVVII